MAKRPREQEDAPTSTSDIPERIQQIHAELADMVGRIAELEDELKELASRHEVELGALRETVMVVDDSRLVRTLLRGLLQSAGYQVVEAESGMEALGILESRSVDLLILDIKMPDMDGLELLAAIRDDEKIENMPVLICTASRERMDFQAAGRLRVQGAIGKPVNREALLEKVAEILKGDPPEEAPEDVEVFDRANALVRVEGDRTLLAEIIQAYLDEYQGGLQRMRRAMSNQDVEELHREAHSMKGAVGNIGGKATYDAALELEKTAETGDLVTARSVYRRLEQENLRLREALEGYLKA